eukprot:330201-Amphidinium_carterae.1
MEHVLVAAIDYFNGACISASDQGLLLHQKGAKRPPQSEGATEPQPKRHGTSLACAACWAKAKQGTIWANTETKAGVVVPVGDRCMQCHKVWQAGFSYIDWVAYCELAKSEATDLA